MERGADPGMAQQTRGAHMHFYFWRGTIAFLTFSKIAVRPQLLPPLPAPGPPGRIKPGREGEHMAHGHHIALKSSFTKTFQTQEPAAAFGGHAVPHTLSTPPPAPHAGSRSVQWRLSTGPPTA